MPGPFWGMTYDLDTFWRGFESEGDYSRLLVEVVFHQALVRYWKQ